MRKVTGSRFIRQVILTAAAVLCMTGSGRQAYGAEKLFLPEAGPGEAAGPGVKGVSMIPYIASLWCTTDGNYVNIQGNVWGSTDDLAEYDDCWYLFELPSYEDQIDGRTDYAAKWNKGDAISCSMPLEDEEGSDRLYSKFVLAVYDGVRYYGVCEPAYITNPEALAVNKKEFKTPATKKGLLLDGEMIDDALELEVKQISINIAFQQLFGEGISYEYGGKVYHFNKNLVEYYDKVVGTMTARDIGVTAIILNGWNEGMRELFLPGVEKSSRAYYYNFNGSTAEGAEIIKAAASFLAERYSGGEGAKGKISNWVIGNEINNNEIWNYAGSMEQNRYVREYMKAFRIFYTAVKRVSSSDRLYISLDYNWTDPEASLTRYGARDVLDTFGTIVKEGGDIDWGLAYHPYADPLTEPEFWDDGENGKVTDSVDSRIVNFHNLHILTEYMKRQELLKADGKVRHIILSEQGFTSKSASRGDVGQIQAAALIYAYYIADNNPYIDAVLMNRQVDSVAETTDSVALGLWECDMSSPYIIVPTIRKPSWEVFRGMDREEYLESTSFAKEIIGIERWSDVIPDFKWKKYENR